MAIAMVHEVPGMTTEDFDRVDALLRAQGKREPDGRIFLVAASADEGMLVVDVWDSEEKMEAFTEVLLPILAEAGAPQVKPRILAVHDYILPSCGSA